MSADVAMNGYTEQEWLRIISPVSRKTFYPVAMVRTDMPILQAMATSTVNQQVRIAL